MTDKEKTLAFIEERIKWNEDMLQRDPKPSDIGRIEEAKCIRRFIESLQEEPVRGDFEMALAEMIDKAQKCVVEPWVVAAQWKDELLRLAKEEPVSIWHDANQQPEINTPILVRTYDNIVASTKRYDDNLIPWEDRIKRDEITHWCYVEDLLKL